MHLKNVYEIVMLIVALIVMVQWLNFVFNSQRTDFDVNAETYVRVLALNRRWLWCLLCLSLNIVRTAAMLTCFNLLKSA